MDCSDVMKGMMMTSEWLPIETAPKDRDTRLLGFIPSYREPVQFIAWGGGRWWDAGIWEPLAKDQQPTHWTPLPPPPATPTKGLTSE